MSWLSEFYHIKNLQSTKTHKLSRCSRTGFITLRIYKVLKLQSYTHVPSRSFITLRIYKVLKQSFLLETGSTSFITLRIYKVLKPQQRLYALIHS